MEGNKINSHPTFQKSRDIEDSESNEVFTEIPESLISKICDQFNLKESLIKLSKKTPWNITNEFLDALILFFFLFLVFRDAGILKFEFTLHIIALSVIGLSALIELFVINTHLLKKYFGKDANTKRILKGIDKLSPREIKKEIKSLTFSSKCINFFLELLKKEPSKYPPYILEEIIDTQRLRNENFNLLFDPIILENTQPKIIIRVLAKYRDCLSQNNILNLYSVYKENENILKVMIATQSNSYFLIEKFPEDESLFKLYNKYQENKEHLDLTLKIVPISKFRPVLDGLLTISFLIFLVIFLLDSPINSSASGLEIIMVFIGVSTGSLMLATLISYVFVGFFFRKIIDYYYSHLVSNILK